MDWKWHSVILAQFWPRVINIDVDVDIDLDVDVK